MKKRIVSFIMAAALTFSMSLVGGAVYADEVTDNNVVTQENTDGSTGEVTDATTDGSTDETTDGSTDTSANENTDAATDDTVTESVDDTSDEVTDDTSDDTSDQTRPAIGTGGKITIAIDAGHGGSDPGAKYYGMEEKDLNLKIATYLKEFLETYQGITVYMTRESDVYLGLEERVINAKEAGADLFISIHNNASSNVEASGSEVYCPNKNFNQKIHTIGTGLGNSIVSELGAMGMNNRGIFCIDSKNGTTYSDGSAADYYAVIRHAKKSGIPGIIVEHAFMTNSADAEFLSDDANLKALAMADSKGIVNYLSLEPEKSQIPDVTIMSPGTGNILLSWDEVSDAKGYLVYRSTKKKKGYEKVGKLTGASNNIWLDDTVPVGTKYYYKVRSYRYINGYYIFSDYSDVFEGHTIGGTNITRVLQRDNYIKLWWEETPDADGYQILRKESGVGTYEVVGNVYDKASYADRTVEENVNYVYKVVPLNNLSGNEGYGTESKIFRATYIGAPEIKKVKIKSKGRIGLSWRASENAAAYEVYRSELEDGDYKLVATLDSSKTAYTDPETEVGKTYYYCIKALQPTTGKFVVEGASELSDGMGIKNFDTPVLYAAQISTETDGVYLQWSNVYGATQYRIYRSTKPDSGFKAVKKVSPDEGEVTDYTDKFESEPGETYYYKIKAGITLSDETLLVSDASNVLEIVTGYSIMGDSHTEPEQMVRFFRSREENYPSEIYEDFGAPTLEDFIEIVYEEAEAEGVKAEVVLGQICKETGFLRFQGDVSPEQCNFAGIGATGGGVKGAAFPDVRTGIRAQVQHLKAYASNEDLNNECVDPRFDYVTRGTAIYVEWLGISENPFGGGWATAIRYGYSMRDDYIKPLLAS